jgi:hypothetical protein
VFVYKTTLLERHHITPLLYLRWLSIDLSLKNAQFIQRLIYAIPQQKDILGEHSNVKYFDIYICVCVCVCTLFEVIYHLKFNNRLRNYLFCVLVVFNCNTWFVDQWWFLWCTHVFNGTCWWWVLITMCGNFFLKQQEWAFVKSGIFCFTFLWSMDHFQWIKLV